MKTLFARSFANPQRRRLLAAALLLIGTLSMLLLNLTQPARMASVATTAPEVVTADSGTASTNGNIGGTGTTALTVPGEHQRWFGAMPLNLVQSIFPKTAVTALTSRRSVADSSSGNQNAHLPTRSNAAPAALLMPAPFSAKFDFDGDSNGFSTNGKADIGFWTPNTAYWQIKKSTTGITAVQQQGVNTDRIVPADYDGDGKTDYAVWTPANGYWTIRKSSNNTTVQQQWGATGDIPVPADFNGDGKADYAVWRPSSGFWYVLYSNGGSFGMQLGDQSSGDYPAVGDYDNDGKADVAVWRSSDGYWYVRQSSNSSVVWMQFGQDGDTAVPADYDGDGITDYAVWRPMRGSSTWYIWYSSNNSLGYAQFGVPGDVLVPADYDGDNAADYAVWRPANGTWYIAPNSGAQPYWTAFGAYGDIPVPAVYINQQIPPGTGSSSPVQTPTNPAANGSANPSSVAAGGTTLLTVTVTPGTNPTSTGIIVKGNLSTIGGSSQQVFNNNGGNVFTFNAAVPAGNALGGKSLTITVTDGQGRSAPPTNIALTVTQPTPTNPVVTNSTANPNQLQAGYPTLLSVTVAPGTNPTSTNLSVTGNLSSIGGSSAQVFSNNGNNVFTFSATVAAGTTAGSKSLPINVTDGQGRSALPASIALTVTPPIPLGGTGNASPSQLAAGGATTLTVTVTPATNPPSTGITVKGNLTAIGGISEQTFYDDGTNGDAAAGDKIFSYRATIPLGTTAGSKSLPVSIADAQNHTATASIALTVAAPTPTPTPTPTVTPTPMPPVIYNAVNDFSQTNNPAGAWSYGYKVQSASAFTLYADHSEFWSGLFNWFFRSSHPGIIGQNYTPPTPVMIVKNATGSTTQYDGSVVQPVDLLNLRPGGMAPQSIARWTAPASGTYRIAGRFEGIDNGATEDESEIPGNGTTTNVQILHNGAPVQSGSIEEYGAQLPYNFQVTVAAGDTIDFAVDSGFIQSSEHDSTGLAAIITLISATLPPSPTPTVTPTVTPTPTPTPPGVTQATLSRARLSPRNATGGTNLYSQNFGWGTNLVNLPGRAGLDAGLSISYNSLLWTKVGTTMVFDADSSNVSPGFRFGFPVLEQPYYDPVTGKTTYLMVTPSGARVELRQTATGSSLYEAADSSYLQLEVVTNTNGQQLVLRSTDGTQMKYSLNGSVFRCSEIKDRNGNIITINHNQNGLLEWVKDTLGRVINVNYDAQSYPSTITQAWKTGNGGGTNVTHTYATFDYTTVPVNTNFIVNGASLAISGITNGASLKVLQKITVTDGSSTTFEYNGYGQVKKINNYASDLHLLNSVRTDLESAVGGAARSDCPRFTETGTYVENFNNNQETVAHNSFAENQPFSVGGMSGSATKVIVSMDNAPHGVTSTMWYYPAGNWKEGLQLASEDFGDGIRRRWTTTSWTQDNTTPAYLLNPRVTESKVGDSSNIKRTVIDYALQPNTNVSLTGEVKLYDGINGTLLKRSTTGYNASSTYLNRRIIGLPAESNLYDASGSLMSRVTYAYDASDALQQNFSPVQHDGTSYSIDFNAGRGNLTSTTRYDVLGGAAAVTSSVKYNTTGGVVAQTDPLGRTITIGYEDSFNDYIPKNTYAYPTTLTDAAGYSSSVQYRYDTGANVRAQSPDPTGSNFGKTTSREFDAVGRLIKETLLNNGAYTRYDYTQSDRDTHSKVYSTILDVTGNGADSTDEVLTESWTDGAGRVYKSRTENPGSGGGWSGQKTVYDILGQVKQQTPPTEIDLNWSPSGDDFRGANVWLWTQQEYDWKGRVTKTTNTDGTFKTVNYEGCGCAGGQVTTIQSELVPVPGQAYSARKTQKVYDDVLGRTVKSQVMNWDGTTPYTTTITDFNGRDQAKSVKQYQGAEGSSTVQETTMSYDGYGRLKTEHRPEQQDANGAATYTNYNYNPDNSISSVTDARGARTAYTYNTRGLLEQISYSAPSNIQLPSNVTYNYDALGNRISMTDELGTVNYEYNPLSQMTAETRHFTDNLPNAPQRGTGTNQFRLEYTYNLSGGLQSYKDPYEQQINYEQDKTGRLKSVTGSYFGGVTTYAANPGYRAWGALKHLEYGNGDQMNVTFNNRLEADSYALTKSGTAIMQKNYQYYADGSLKYVQDVLNPIFDRLNTYDHLGRIQDAKSGAEARGIPVTQNLKTDLPYRQSYVFDVFGNMTQRLNTHWGEIAYQQQTFNLNYTYQNNRIINNSVWLYDADGRVTQTFYPDKSVNSAYDAAGQLIMMRRSNNDVTNRYTDGDGREGKREMGTCSTAVTNQRCPQWNTGLETRYYIRSSVLGKEVVSEVTSDGKKRKTFVMAAGTMLAWQTVGDGANGIREQVYFQHSDASGMSGRTTNSQGYAFLDEDEDTSPVESDAMGGNAGISHPYTRTRPPRGNPNGTNRATVHGIGEDEPNYVNGAQPTIYMNGIEVPYAIGIGMVGRGSARITGMDGDFTGLGIIRIPGMNNAPSPSNAPDGGSVGNSDDAPIKVDNYGTSDKYIIFGSWNLQQQFQPPQTPESATPTTPQKDPPCPWQNFDIFSEGALGATGNELNEIVRTAVGEASVKYAAGEVENIIHIMENMLTHNNYATSSATSDYTWKTFGKPKSGSTNISDVLGEFDAYKLHSDRAQNKINGASRANQGVLGISSTACRQINEAVTYLTTNGAIGFTGQATTINNVLQNRGVGARTKNVKGLKFLFTIGDTDFWTYESMTIPRRKRR